jgi:hypothetical protein
MVDCAMAGRGRSSKDKKMLADFSMTESLISRILKNATPPNLLIQP